MAFFKQGAAKFSNASKKATKQKLSWKIQTNQKALWKGRDSALRCPVDDSAAATADAAARRPYLQSHPKFVAFFKQGAAKFSNASKKATKQKLSWKIQTNQKAL